jgi:hypothetical protein
MHHAARQFLLDQICTGLQQSCFPMSKEGKYVVARFCKAFWQFVRLQLLRDGAVYSAGLHVDSPEGQVYSGFASLLVVPPRLVDGVSQRAK